LNQGKNAMLFVKGFLMVVLLFTAIFLVVLVLIQRGKGGGLAGAFGGMGGQSAFGTKAGDLFTKITIGLATFWIVLCMITVKVLGVGSAGPISQSLGGDAGQRPGVSAPAPADKNPDAGKGGAAPGPAEKTEK
jgi:preprotein translocase subunit SecG